MPRPFYKNYALVSKLLALLTVAVITLLYYLQTPALESFEAKSYDLRFKVLRGALPAADNIAIIAINEKSINELGRFPWTRHRFAELVRAVHRTGAKALLFDMFFPEPESRAADGDFAAALKEAGNVTLAMAFDFAEDWSIRGETANIGPLAEAARDTGHINMLPDEDGVNRRTMLLIPHEGALQPSLALRGAMAALDCDRVEQRRFDIRLDGRSIPTDAYHTMLINYLGPPGRYPIHSFVDVLKGRVDPEALNGKILFVGMTALGIYDMRVTPFNNNTPGVEINATIADNIIRGSFIRRSGVESLVDLLSIILLGLATFYIAARFHPSASILLLPLMAGGYLALAYGLFLAGHWLSFVYPTLSIITAYTLSTGFRFVILDRRAREVRSIFSSYVSPKIVNELVNNPDKAIIGGVTRQITVSFFDIKGFTTFSEQRPPLEVVSTLNAYLAAMTHEILQFGGTVDKFLGDGLMAYWGAPLPQKDHAELAVSCMFSLGRAIDELQRTRPELPRLTFRTGINSGEVIAGNIGARGKKMEYTVIGDAVNLASRLEGTAKFYGVDILVSESTRNLCGDRFLFRELDRLRVVGKSIPIGIHQLVAADATVLAAGEQELLAGFADALAAYRVRDWQSACQRFTALCQRFPADQPSRIYRERCASFAANPPPETWDGVFERQEK